MNGKTSGTDGYNAKNVNSKTMKTNINNSPFHKPSYQTESKSVYQYMIRHGWNVELKKKDSIKLQYLFLLLVMFLAGMVIMVYALEYGTRQREQTLEGIEQIEFRMNK